MATAYDLSLELQLLRKQGQLPELLHDFDQKPVVVVGAAGSGTQLHVHEETWQAHFAGRKAWWLIENSSSEVAFKEMVQHTSHPCSWLTEPLQVAKEARFCIVQPGEVLYFGDHFHATCLLDDFVFGAGFQGRFDGKSEFDRAMHEGDLEALQELVDEHPDPKKYLGELYIPKNGGRPFSPIVKAAGRNLTQMVKYIVAITKKTSQAHPQEMTPMHSASFAGHLAMVHLLLESRAEVNPVFHFTDETPLHMAVGSGSGPLVKHLLEQRADVRRVTKQGDTAMHISALYGHVEIAKHLIKFGAKLALTSRTPTINVAAQHGHAKFITYLITLRSSVNAKSSEGVGPLHLAASHGHRGATRCLLELGAKGDLVDKDGWSALHHSVKSGRIDIFEYVIAKDPNAIDVTTKKGETALHIAAAAKPGHADLVKALLKRRADIEATTHYMNSAPLQLATNSGNKDIMQLLLENRAQCDEFCESRYFETLDAGNR
eukprot:gnl/MRDRNA2_/MRDRNA2_189045_c0_seq1.p1 gnl/MRDRNA2_/MRDRNA2_189045_c0~~gnl/MRDRNA2_/MRDRNA2_189045_c0_seq1.p1  ORF type:complete len:542 (-),score=108.10 gnl/MRDRNA2_/MRDRNA2_189045_c0_seq1:61-1524(-)